MTPHHLSYVAVHIAPLTPRSIPEYPVALCLSGLEPFGVAS